jgi:hypothetical protein
MERGGADKCRLTAIALASPLHAKTKSCNLVKYYLANNAMKNILEVSKMVTNNSFYIVFCFSSILNERESYEH